MSAVFLDTVGVLALLERSDQWHEAASRAWAALLEAGRPLRTTTPVLLECGNAVARKPYRRDPARVPGRWHADHPDRSGHRFGLASLRAGRGGQCRDRRSRLVRRDAPARLDRSIRLGRTLPGGRLPDAVLSPDGRRRPVADGEGPVCPGLPTERATPRRPRPGPGRGRQAGSDPGDPGSGSDGPQAGGVVAGPDRVGPLTGSQDGSPCPPLNGSPMGGDSPAASGPSKSTR